MLRLFSALSLTLLLAAWLTPASAQESRELVLVHAKKNKSKVIRAGDKVHYRWGDNKSTTAGRVDSIGETSIWVKGEEVTLDQLVLIRKRDAKWKAAMIVGGTGAVAVSAVWISSGIAHLGYGLFFGGGYIPATFGIFATMVGKAVLAPAHYALFESGHRLDRNWSANTVVGS